MDELHRWLLQDLADHGEMMCGWDWDADHRLAHHLGDAEAAQLIGTAIRPNNRPLLAHLRAAYMTPTWQRVYRKRLRVLRALADQNYVVSSWTGMPSSVTGGATRTKLHQITSLGSQFVAKTRKEAANGS